VASAMPVLEVHDFGGYLKKEKKKSAIKSYSLM